MGAFAIDTLALSQTLRGRGFSEEQATGIVDVFRDLDGSELATRAEKIDRSEARLDAKIDKVAANLDAKLEVTAASLEDDILRWMIVTQIAVGGFILAGLKFVK